MNVLIIGSEGFIGSACSKYFKSNISNSVTCADVVIMDKDGYIAINPEFPDFARLFYNRKFDVCINATGAANVQFSFNHAAFDFMLNAANVFHILEAIRQFNPECKFINFSSAAVYGNPVYLPIDESHQVSPVSPYGCHKIYSEQICKEFFDYFKIETLSLRVFSAYGPGLKKQLFWDLYQKCKNDTFELFGTGHETRDFIYIDDLVQIIDLVINNLPFNGQCVNVANGEQLKVKDVVREFIEQFEWKGSIIYKNENKIGDPMNWEANIDIVKRVGYAKSVTIEEGVKRYIKWLKEQD